MISLTEIMNLDIFSILMTMKNRDNYFAHIKEEKKETLYEHTDLVMKYFNKLVTNNNLNNLIDSLIIKDVTKVLPHNQIEIYELVKIMFVSTIYFHDFGKVNQNFQREKMGNLSFPKINNGIRSDHSLLSMYLFLAFFYKRISDSNFTDEEKEYLYVISTALSHSITKHHGELSNAYDFEVNETLLNLIDTYYSLFENLVFIKNDSLQKLLNQAQALKDYKYNFTDDTAGFILLKLNSSLLTAADYLATNEFMLGNEITDFGILNKELKTKIINGVETIPYNRNLYDNFNFYLELKFEDLQFFSNDSLNKLRQKLSAEVIFNFSKNKEAKLFYIEAPTGSGKTNLSLLLISELLKTRRDITKIFYVFPFISLITQNVDEFKKCLSLSSKEIVQIHSKASFLKSKQDDFYGSLKQNYIDALFVNFPFVLLSHIKFFNSLISNDKEDNYLLHRLANSVVIIDELQSYSPSEWDKLSYLIYHFSDSLNITFILMSATLPKISKLLTDAKLDKFIYLVPNKHNYFTNTNFANRVVFNFDYLNKESFSFSNESLADIVIKHSEEYFTKSTKVNTLIEFVTKKSAKSFYEHIRNEDKLKEYELLFIDGTVLEPRRLEIIDYLKSNEKANKIIIVATQVIEAGLNLDMDIGFKDISILDSEEQFAGRINRNANKIHSTVYLFNSDNSKYVYKKDLRFIEQKKIPPNDLYQILKEKKFDDYYSYVFSNITKYNNSLFSENISSFINYLKTLKFWDARNNFKLIESKTISVYVPLAINHQYFSTSELEYLTQMHINANSNYEIDGEEVFEFYTKLISTKIINNDFLSKKAEIKMLSAIMSKFVFNSYFNENFINVLRHYGEERFGYFYLSNWGKVYSYQDGLKSDLESDCNSL